MTLATPSAARKSHKWPRKTGLVDDPYAWLIHRNDPDVVKYLNAENEYAESWFSAHRDVTEEIFQEIKTRVKEDDNTYPVQHNGWWYTSRTQVGQSYAIHTRGHSPDSASEYLLIDENLEAQGHSYFSLSAFEISHSNTLLAWSSDTDGSEKYTLRIRNLDTGFDLIEEIPQTTWAGVAWSTDDHWLFYVVADDAMRPWQVWRHKIGTSIDSDELVFEEPDERFFVGISATRSEKWIIIDSSSKTSSETWLVDARSPQTPARCVVPRQDNIEYSVDHWGDRFAILTNKDAQDFRVVIADESTPDNWRDFISHVEGQRITGLDCFHNYAVMQRWVDAQQVISLVAHDGTTTDIHILDDPHEVELDANPNWELESVRVSFQSLSRPATIAAYNIATSQMTTLKTTEVLNVDLTNYTSTRLWAHTEDGTAVPVDFVRHVDTPIDGTAPCVLYVYGAYEISTPPWFSVARLSLLDRGWVWALAHPRGGGELGRRWYEGGKLLNKKNTFTDTIAVAHHLGAQHIVDPKRIVLRGGSAGGLAVGACISHEPHTFAAAIAEVPFVDVTNTMCDPSLPLTVTEWEEWGDPRDEPYFSYISSYSPYDNVSNVVYPTLYVTAGLNDPRVSYHEPAKWVAKIRHESPQSTVVFRCEMESGHGGPSGRYEQWREEAKTLSFALAATNSTQQT
ncbi:MAG: hypothetical protein RIR69_48 [Actinomycetota bacterium]|jgi:oligopeptidase B